MLSRLDPSMFNRIFTYSEYLEFITSLVAKGLSSGPDQSEKLTHFTKLNFQRLKRIYKTLQLSARIPTIVKDIESDMLWVVIVESWCGDVPQSIPYMEAISQLSDKIKFRIILRDQNPRIMDRFLTNGTRSIPKLICLNPKTFEVVGTWGPRPEGARNLVKTMLGDPAITADMRKEAVQRWYMENKGQELMDELGAMVQTWDGILLDQHLTDAEYGKLNVNRLLI